MKRIILILILVILSSCKEDSPTSPIEKPKEVTLGNGLVLKENVKIINSTNDLIVSKITPNSISFSNVSEEFKDLKVGDKIISGPNGEAPFGFRREITGLAKMNNSDEITFITKLISYAEIIKSGKVTFNKTLFDLNTGAKRYLLYDFDQNPTNNINQFDLIRIFSLNSKISGFMEFGNKVVFNTHLTLDGKIDVTIFGDVTADINGVVPISKTYLSPIPLWSPPPIYVTPLVEVFLKIDFDTRGDFDTGFIQEIDLDVDINYDGNWEFDKGLKTPFFKKETSLVLNSNIKATLVFKVSLIMNELTGPVFSLDSFLELNSAIALNPKWILYAGLNGSVGVESGFLGEWIPEANYPFNITKVEISRASSNLNTPPYIVYTIKPGGTGTTETIFEFDVIQSHDFETSQENLKFRWDFEGDGTWDTDYKKGRYFYHQYPEFGGYKPKVEGIDEGGLTDSYSAISGISVSQPIEQKEIILQPGSEGKDAEIIYNYFSNGSESFSGESNTEIMCSRLQIFNNGNSIAEQNILIKFDLPSKLNSKNIISANFEFYCDASSNSNEVGVKFEKMNSFWSEQYVKWDMKFNSTLYKTKNLSDDPNQSFTWENLDITSLVQQWINGETNNGLRIKMSSNETSFFMHSSDGPDASKRPKLTIIYQ